MGSRRDAAGRVWRSSHTGVRRGGGWGSIKGVVAEPRAAEGATLIANGVEGATAEPLKGPVEPEETRGRVHPVRLVEGRELGLSSGEPIEIEPCRRTSQPHWTPSRRWIGERFPRIQQAVSHSLQFLGRKEGSDSITHVVYVLRRNCGVQRKHDTLFEELIGLRQ